MKVDLLQARCDHCDSIYVLGIHPIPPDCPSDADQIVTTISIDLEDRIALLAIEAGVAFHHEDQELGN